MTNKERCDPEVFSKGHVVCHFHAEADVTEAWVRKVAEESGQRVDWSYFAGYAGVKFIGDEQRVRSAVEKLRPLLKCVHFRLYEPVGKQDEDCPVCGGTLSDPEFELEGYRADAEALAALRRIIKEALSSGQLEKLEDARRYLQP